MQGSNGSAAKGEIIKAATSTADRILSVDIIKYIAIVMVITTHFYADDTQRLRLLYPFWIEMAVPVFVILSGFSYSLSVKKREITGCFSWFEKKNLMDKLTRVLVPYLITFAVQAATSLCIGKKFSLSHIFFILLTGGWGSGNYYTPIILQLILFFPLVYFSFQKNKVKTVVVTILINISYEALVSIVGISDDIYRLCAARYLTFLLAGIILFEYSTRLEKTLLPFLALLIGSAYIFLLDYTDLEFKLITQWKGTSLFAAPYAFALVYGLMRLFHPLKNNNPVVKIFSGLGKATYHIMLVQMAYYWLPAVGALHKSLPLPVGVLMSVLVCTGFGVIFYKLEHKLSSLVFAPRKLA